MANRRLLILFLIGLGVRILTLSLPGTEDMRTNQIWGAWTVEEGVTRTYVLTDADYLTKALLFWRHLPYQSPPPVVKTELGTLDHVPNYPPLSVYSFWLSSLVVKTIRGGRLQAGNLLNAAFNFWPLLGALGILVVAWRLMQAEGVAEPWWIFPAFWLNPVILLQSPILGYVDAVFTFLGLCSLILLYQKRFTGSIIFVVFSCLTKPQGVLLLPVVLVAILAERDWRLFRRASLSFVICSFAPFLPFIIAGRGLAALRGMMQVVHTGYLSSNQMNLWWIVSWALPAASEKSLGALGREVVMRGLGEFQEVFILDARWIALLLLGVFMAVNLYYLWGELKKGNRLAIFWASALQVYIFTMLALHPHENHLYPFFVFALPLFLLGQRKFAGIYVTLSLVFGLNIFLFEGFGRGMAGPGSALRFVAGLDLTILIAFFNVAVFAWLVTRKRWLYGLTLRPTPS